MGSCIWGTPTSRNSQTDKAEKKAIEANILENGQKIKDASSIERDPSKSGYKGIVLKKNSDFANPVNTSEEKPFVYVQPNDELAKQINNAALIEDDRKAIEELKRIAAKITEKNQKSLNLMEKLAFVSTSLAERYAKIDQLEQCKKQEQRALHIFSQFQSEYFEELIVILNNSALRNQKAGQYEKAIEKYMTIDKLEDKYYSIHDERKLLNMNNLACLYFETNKKKEGKQLFDKILAKIVQHKYSNEVVNLLKANYLFYFKPVPQ